MKMGLNCTTKVFRFTDCHAMTMAVYWDNMNKQSHEHVKNFKEIRFWTLHKLSNVVLNLKHMLRTSEYSHVSHSPTHRGVSRMDFSVIARYRCKRY